MSASQVWSVVCLCVLPWTLSVAVKKLVITSLADSPDSNLLLFAVQFKVGSSVIFFRDFVMSWRLLDGRLVWYSHGLESFLSTFHCPRWDIRVGVVQFYLPRSEKIRDFAGSLG